MSNFSYVYVIAVLEDGRKIESRKIRPNRVDHPKFGTAFHASGPFGRYLPFAFDGPCPMDLKMSIRPARGGSMEDAADRWIAANDERAEESASFVEPKPPPTQPTRAMFVETHRVQDDEAPGWARTLMERLAKVEANVSRARSEAKQASKRGGLDISPVMVK